MRVDGLLPELARAMSEWRLLLGLAMPRIYITALDEDVFAIERVDPKEISDEESYLVIETESNRIVGILRDGMLDADIYRVPASTTACTLFRAAKA